MSITARDATAIILVFTVIMITIAAMAFLRYIDLRRECKEFREHAISKSCFYVGAVSVTFKNLMKFYNLNPERYSMDKKRIRVNSEYIPGDGKIQEYYLYFDRVADHIKYLLFLKRMEEDKAKQKRIRATSEYLETVQRDISTYAERSQQEVERRLDELSAVSDKLKKLRESDIRLK